MSAQLHVVLVCPEIPQNTGNVGRMCAITGARLHLVHPLGFTIDDRHLRRAGMDYWRSLDVHEHDSLAACLASPHGPKRAWLFTRHAATSFWQASYAAGDGLIFGRESTGLDQESLALVANSQQLFVDQPNSALRSLNLATCAGIATYEALRQFRAAG